MLSLAQRQRIAGDDTAVEDKAHKTARADLFVEFLLEHFGGAARVGAGAGVLDVAGGRGDVGFELFCKRGIHATLVEPRARKLNKAQRQFFKKRKKAAKKASAAAAATAVAEGGGGGGSGGGGSAGAPASTAAMDVDTTHRPAANAAAAAAAALVPSSSSSVSSVAAAADAGATGPAGNDGPAEDVDALCPHIQERFDPSWCSRHSDLLNRVSLIAAMHPDEATEEIVDTAVQMRKPFAVVPCCVFPKLGGRMSYTNWVSAQCFFFLVFFFACVCAPRAGMHVDL